jgi:hypothetical protein
MNQLSEHDFDRFVLAMALLYATRPNSPTADATGAYYIADVGEARLDDQRLQRDTPYSICRGLRPREKE